MRSALIVLLLLVSPASAQSYMGWRDMKCGPGTWPCPVPAVENLTVCQTPDCGLPSGLIIDDKPFFVYTQPYGGGISRPHDATPEGLSR